jgi:hypothetical protein
MVQGRVPMVWKKLVEAEDLIVLEKHLKDYKVKIEARHDLDKWYIFKSYIYNNESSLVSEFSLNSLHEVKKKINDLKKEKVLTLDELRRVGSPRLDSVHVSMKRVYKEEFVEKWLVSITRKDEKNFVLVRYDDDIKIDFVIDERYKQYQEEINRQVEEKLGLNDFSEFIAYNIYYFRDHVEKIKPSDDGSLKNSIAYGHIDIEFGFDDEN